MEIFITGYSRKRREALKVVGVLLRELLSHIPLADDTVMAVQSVTKSAGVKEPAQLPTITITYMYEPRADKKYKGRRGGLHVIYYYTMYI